MTRSVVRLYNIRMPMQYLILELQRGRGVLHMTNAKPQVRHETVISNLKYSYYMKQFVCEISEQLKEKSEGKLHNVIMQKCKTSGTA
jgi:hypothetical protein